jgi:hypothetical protein
MRVTGVVHMKRGQLGDGWRREGGREPGIVVVPTPMW